MTLLATKLGTLSSFKAFSIFMSKLFLFLLIPFLLIGCGDDNKIAVAAGGSHSLVLDNEGNVYAAGNNNDGQLGFNNNNAIHYINGNCKMGGVLFNYTYYCEVFTKVSSLEGKNITAVAAGDHDSLALDSNGNVYTEAYDYDGHSAFVAATSLEGKNIIAISARGNGYFALDGNGKVYVAGVNSYGQLGLGDTNNRDDFTEVVSLNGKHIIYIAAGEYHTLAIDSDGKVYATGENYGQLGLGDNNDRNTFTEVTSLSGKNITAVAAGSYHSLAIDSDGKVYATGENYGQLGLGDNNDRNTFTEVTSLNGVTAISAGAYHSLILDGTGKVYGAGSNSYGQLGLGNADSSYTFVEIPSLNGKNITTIAAGDDYSFVIDNKGNVYGTGSNSYGLLGLGDTNSRNVFTEVKH
jgi:alpha-tubulin suppressor-like RCC1 family protein